MTWIELIRALSTTAILQSKQHAVTINSHHTWWNSYVILVCLTSGGSSDVHYIYPNENRSKMKAPEAFSTAKQGFIAKTCIRALLKRLLNMWGYHTLVASNGKEAMEVAAQHTGDIDSLLSDVTMARKMGGQELAEKLTKKRPFIKVIGMHVILRRGLGIHREALQAFRCQRNNRKDSVTAPTAQPRDNLRRFCHHQSLLINVEV